MVLGDWAVVSLNTGPLISRSLPLPLSRLLTSPFISFLENLFFIISHTQSWSGKVGRRQGEAEGVKFRKFSRQKKDLIPTIFPFHVDVAGFQ